MSSRKRPRKPKRPLPRVPKYVAYTGGGRRYWRMGGPLTKEHEADARAAQRARRPGRIGRLVLRVLGAGRPERTGRAEGAGRPERTGRAEGAGQVGDAEGDGTGAPPPA